MAKMTKREYDALPESEKVRLIQEACDSILATTGQQPLADDVLDLLALEFNLDLKPRPARKPAARKMIRRGKGSY